MHADLHTHKRKLRTDKHPSIHPCRKSCYLPNYIHIYIKTYIHTYVHTYIHTVIHTYAYSYIYTYTTPKHACSTVAAPLQNPSVRPMPACVLKCLGLVRPTSHKRILILLNSKMNISGMPKLQESVPKNTSNSQVPARLAQCTLGTDLKPWSVHDVGSFRSYADVESPVSASRYQLWL